MTSNVVSFINNSILMNHTLASGLASISHHSMTDRIALNRFKHLLSSIYISRTGVPWWKVETTPTFRHVINELYQPSLSAKWLPTFCGWRVPCGQRDGSLWPYSRFYRQEQLFFYQVAPQLYSRGWVDPVPDPLLILLAALGPGVYSASNRSTRSIKIIMFLGSKERLVRRADNLTTISKPIV
jgi:hypothetical protein